MNKEPISNITIPPSPHIIEEAIKLLKDSNSKLENIVVCISQDPSLTINILSAYNINNNLSSNKNSFSIKKAITNLGINKTLEITKKLQDVAPPENAELNNYLECYRNKAKRASIVAKILAEIVNKNLEDICSTAGLLLYTGYLVSISILNEKFINIAKNSNLESKIRYQLAKLYNINVYSATISYVKRFKIPGILIGLLDNTYSKTSDKDFIMAQEIVWAAHEIVESYDANKWGLYAPSKELPPTSILRILSITHNSYIKLYEMISGFFISFKIFNEDNNKQNSVEYKRKSGEILTDGNATKEERNSEAEIEKLKQEKIIKKRNEYFALNTKERVIKHKEEIIPIVNKIKKNEGLLDSVLNTLSQAKSSEKAITNILELLIDQGSFEKAALIVTSKDKKKAIIVCARGEFPNGQEIPITNEFSPLIGNFSKVQSFGNKNSVDSPFGSKSFAMAPINMNHETPVILYADFGKNDSLPFNARRAFRDTLDLLNNILPSLPGGLPIEI